MSPYVLIDHLTCLIRSPARSPSGERIFDALVQPANSIAVESLIGDFQLGRRKKSWRQFLDRETDGVRGAGKSSVPDRLPHPPPIGGEEPARGRGQLRLGAVIKNGHLPGPPVCEKQAMAAQEAARLRLGGAGVRSDDLSSGRRHRAEPEPFRGRTWPRAASPDRHCPERRQILLGELAPLRRISVGTISLVSAAVSGFAAVASDAVFVM